MERWLYDELSNISHYFSSAFKFSNFSQNFPTATILSNFSETFQLQKKLSNFARFFPILLGSLKFRLALSNFSETFQLQSFQLKTFQLLVLPNCPFQLHVSQKITQKIKLITRYSGFLFGFCFQKWRSVTHPKQIFRNFLGFCFRKWRSVTHSILGFCFRDLPIWVNAKFYQNFRLKNKYGLKLIFLKSESLWL